VAIAHGRKSRAGRLFSIGGLDGSFAFFECPVATSAQVSDLSCEATNTAAVEEGGQIHSRLAMAGAWACGRSMTLNGPSSMEP